MTTARDNLQELNIFLAEHRVEKGSPCTHMRCGPMGSYVIDGLDQDKFLRIYNRVLGTANIHMLEKQKTVGPLLVDLDFKFDKDHEKRQYTNKHILYIMGKITEKIKKYVKVTDENLEVFLFEKDSPTRKDDGTFKDGVHIVYPKLPIINTLRHLIIEELANDMDKEEVLKKMLPYCNTVQDIFDISVAYRNGWCMYGSSKSTTTNPYRLTGIYDSECNRKRMTYTEEEFPYLLCVRQYNDEDALQIKDLSEPLSKKLAEIADKYNGKGKNKKKKNNDNDVEIQNEDIDDIDNRDVPKHGEKRHRKEREIEMARRLTEILSSERADTYYSWIRVGWALHNIDDSLLDTFDKFSRRCPNKYKPGCCEEVWNSARDEGLTIGTLHWWAKQDNNEKYIEFLRNNMKTIVQEAESGTEDDLAKVIYELYKYNFKCVSIKKNIWYEFQQHRWVMVESGYTLNNKISDELTKQFLTLASDYLKLGANEDSNVKQEFMKKKGEEMTKIATRLKKTGFKSAVMSACANRFYDSGFEENLDGKTHLIGFNNGIYDLSNGGNFRPGTPDDYVTLSVGYDYKEFTENDPTVQKIKKFFGMVQREGDMHNYVLTLIASYLDGKNKDQKFILWTGSGSNGKSTVVDLIRYAFGGYFGVLPVTVLTRKRGGSSNATPELADKRGKRFLVIQEPEYDDTIYVSYMKELTGSDWISARALYGDPFMYKPQFKMLLTCNRLPHIPANDGGTWRRLRVTPFETEFVDGEPEHPHQFKKNRELGEELKKWNQAFIWLLLKIYYPIYMAKGLDEPKKVTAFTNKYKKASDIYLEYITENLHKVKDEDSEYLSDIYRSFKGWYAESYAKSSVPPKKELREYLIGHEYKIENEKVFGVNIKGQNMAEFN